MLFDEQIARLPNKYSWTQDFINAMWKGHWTPNEFNFQSDLQDYKVTLTEDERQVVKNTLSAIGQIEIAVKKFWSKLGDNLPQPSINDLGTTMANIEVIHNIAYEKLLVTLDLQEIFEENLKLPVIQGRVRYLNKYSHKFHSDNKSQYIYSLILFTAFVENVSLFSQFYIINWFNTFKNVLKDTSQQVLYTSREETLHHLAGVQIVNTLRLEYPELFNEELNNRIIQEAEEALTAEMKVIDWIISDYSGENLDREILQEFIKNRIKNSLSSMGFKLDWEIDEDLISKTVWFDEGVNGNTMTDFFVRRPTEYTKSARPFKLKRTNNE